MKLYSINTLAEEISEKIFKADDKIEAISQALLEIEGLIDHRSGAHINNETKKNVANAIIENITKRLKPSTLTRIKKGGDIEGFLELITYTFSIIGEEDK